MIKPDDIPPEVVARFATWQFPKCTEKLMRSMLADTLNAWPGVREAKNGSSVCLAPHIVLPLKEASDE